MFPLHSYTVDILNVKPTLNTQDKMCLARFKVSLLVKLCVPSCDQHNPLYMTQHIGRDSRHGSTFTVMHNPQSQVRTLTAAMPCHPAGGLRQGRNTHCRWNVWKSKLNENPEECNSCALQCKHVPRNISTTISLPKTHVSTHKLNPTHRQYLLA